VVYDLDGIAAEAWDKMAPPSAFAKATAGKPAAPADSSRVALLLRQPACSYCSSRILMLRSASVPG
jgi:hypothetical protein